MLGFPFQVFSDQAKCEVLEIHKTRTTPDRSSTNGQVERYNRILMDAVRCCVGNSQEQWDLHLPQIAGAMRSAVNRSSGFTADNLMLGREVNIPAYLMFPNRQVKPVAADEYVATLMKNIQTAHNAARNTLQTSRKRMKRDYDLLSGTRLRGRRRCVSPTYCGKEGSV